MKVEVSMATVTIETSLERDINNFEFVAKEILQRRSKGENMTSNATMNGGEFSDELLALSRKHWHVEGKKKLPKFQAKVVDQIFQGLSERSFPLRDLVVLDQSLYLEKYVLLNPLGTL